METIKLLIIDKDHYNQRLLSAILKDKPYVLLFAENKTEAFSCLKSDNKIKLVIIDPIVPSGLEIIREIKTAHPEIPIIAYTVCAVMPEEPRLCYQAGCDLHISKPANIKHIVKSVETMLNKSENK